MFILCVDFIHDKLSLGSILYQSKLHKRYAILILLLRERTKQNSTLNFALSFQVVKEPNMNTSTLQVISNNA